MREIKFRAWDKDEKKMWPVTAIDFELCTCECETGIYLQVNEFIWGKAGVEAIEPNTILMQFTGLRDKNGKEIYEGDVLEFRRAYAKDAELKPFREIVGFADGRFTHLPWGEEKVEIIGNIYENAELLQ